VRIPSAPRGVLLRWGGDTCNVRSVAKARLAEAAEPQPEPQRDLDSYGRSRIPPDAAPLAICVNGTQANFHGREEVAWGSRGRRFKSCQPDRRKPWSRARPASIAGRALGVRTTLHTTIAVRATIPGGRDADVASSRAAGESGGRSAREADGGTGWAAPLVEVQARGPTRQTSRGRLVISDAEVSAGRAGAPP
jgi:hypothetical protein